MVLCDVDDLNMWRTAYIGDALGYACKFWANHLAGTTSNIHDIEEVDKAISNFFETSLLFWIEVLSPMENLDAGVYAINAIEEWYTVVSFIISSTYKCAGVYVYSGGNSLQVDQ